MRRECKIMANYPRNKCGFTTICSHLHTVTSYNHSSAKPMVPAELSKASNPTPKIPPTSLLPEVVGLAVPVPLVDFVGVALPVVLAVAIVGEPVPVACVTGRRSELAAVKVDEAVPLFSLSNANLSKNFMMISFASSFVGPSPMIA